MKPEELSISGELFRSLREQVDGALRSCIRKMRETGMTEGSVGMKIGIEILEDQPVMTGFGMNTVRADTLKIDGKITMTVPMKWENKLATQSGIQCYGAGGGFMVTTGQITFDDLMAAEDDDG